MISQNNIVAGAGVDCYARGVVSQNIIGAGIGAADVVASDINVVPVICDNVAVFAAVDNSKIAVIFDYIHSTVAAYQSAVTFIHDKINTFFAAAVNRRCEPAAAQGYEIFTVTGVNFQFRAQRLFGVFVRAWTQHVSYGVVTGAARN